MKSAMTCVLAAGLFFSLMGGCGPKPTEEQSIQEAIAKISPEDLGKITILSAAASRKGASDHAVQSMVQLYLIELRSTKADVPHRIGAARALGEAAIDGIIGLSASVAAEALYKASRADPDARVKQSANEALKVVERYRKGEVEGVSNFTYYTTIQELSSADPATRKSAAQYLGRTADTGRLGLPGLSTEPALAKMARDDPDPSARMAAGVALQRLRDYKESLDLSGQAIQR